MANPTKTTCDQGTVQLRDVQHADGVVTFGGVATYPEGTILARDSVSLKYVAFVKGGSTNQNGIPKAVLAQALTSGGAGDLPARVQISGEVLKERLIIQADGNDSNIDGAVLDQLSDYKITPVSVKQLARLDN